MSKIALSGNASGTGVFTVASPNSNTDRTLTLPDAAGTLDRLERAGNVLQVVHAINSTYQSTTSTTPVATGLSTSITPSSSSSKILVIVDLQGVGASAATSSPSFDLYRGGSSIHNFDRLTGYGSSSGVYSTSSTTYLDSPATTSSVTYQIYYSRLTGSAAISINNYGTGNASISTMTLMEIAA